VAERLEASQEGISIVLMDKEGLIFKASRPTQRTESRTHVPPVEKRCSIPSGL
jgi:hypothetical protein